MEVFFSFQNNPKNLDLSYKTDLDFWDCLEGTHLIAEFHKNDLGTWGHSWEGKLHFVAE